MIIVINLLQIFYPIIKKSVTSSTNHVTSCDYLKAQAGCFFQEICCLFFFPFHIQSFWYFPFYWGIIYTSFQFSMILGKNKGVRVPIHEYARSAWPTKTIKPCNGNIIKVVVTYGGRYWILTFIILSFSLVDYGVVPDLMDPKSKSYVHINPKLLSLDQNINILSGYIIS